MRTSSAPTSTLATELIEEADATAPELLAIHNCSRLGRTANPPRSWFADIFRPNRRS
jgi:CBS domain containing-hemolysin-like protein